MPAVAEHARAGGAVLGICNGFQILCEAGLLPGGLMRNARLRFLSRPSWVRVEQTDTPFTCLYERGELLEIPIAHGDGRYVVDARTAAELEATERVVWRYVRDNPNGSTNDIAGVTNAGRNVVGIMPHPERRNAPALGGDDGARVFLSMEARHATQHAVDVRARDGRHLREQPDQLPVREDQADHRVEDLLAPRSGSHAGAGHAAAAPAESRHAALDPRARESVPLCP